MDASKRPKLLPPTNLDTAYLYEKYEPLRRAVYKKFMNYMLTSADKEELVGSIDYTFLQLVNEYNANRGVDFPYYIKKMLDLRVYHYISKYLKVTNKESISDNEFEFSIEDESTEGILNHIVEFSSLNLDIELGDKHRELMIGLIIERKTLREIAEDEGVPVDRIHARLYFLTRKLMKTNQKLKELYGEDIY